jgi:hypothetical protein
MPLSLESLAHRVVTLEFQTKEHLRFMERSMTAHMTWVESELSSMRRQLFAIECRKDSE